MIKDLIAALESSQKGSNIPCLLLGFAVAILGIMLWLKINNIEIEQARRTFYVYESQEGTAREHPEHPHKK